MAPSPRARRGRGAKPELYMNCKSHSEIADSGPESVVIAGWISVSRGKSIDGDRFESQISAMLQLVHGIINVGDGNDTHANQSLGCVGTVFLGQPVVIRADDRFVRVVISDAAPEARPHVAGEQHLGINAVFVLLLQALFRRPRSGEVS